jgi:cephalosporin hydroxylase
MNFKEEVADRIAANGRDQAMIHAAREFMRISTVAKYSYNFSCLGRPIIQYPQDMVAMQELIWTVKPDLIIETGIARGGSLILSASMVAVLDMCEAIELGVAFDPSKSSRKVLGLDIDIRAHNRVAIEAHPLASRIQMIQGSSIALDVVAKVMEIASSYKKIMVCLDSNHTHAHVLEELKAYAPLVTKGSYCVVFDTIIEDLPEDSFPDRPWGRGNNPKTAVWEYLKTNKNFEVDLEMEHKLLITAAPNGFLKRVA